MAKKDGNKMQKYDRERIHASDWKAFHQDRLWLTLEARSMMISNSSGVRSL